MRLLDAHLHLIDPGTLEYDWLPPSLRRRATAEELRAEAPAEGVSVEGFVFVQAECAPAQSLAEVDWVAGMSDLPVRGIVARAALERGDGVRDELDALAARPLVVGVRRLLEPEPPGFAASPGFLAGARTLAARGLTFDACVREEGLAEVSALADAVPGLRIVLDHLGKPRVGTPADPVDPRGSAWEAAMRALAERPGTWCKLSGLPAESPGEWTAAQLTPFLDVALDAFGPERLLYGSDWPVSGAAAPWAGLVARWLGDRVGAERAEEALRAATVAAYRLPG